MEELLVKANHYANKEEELRVVDKKRKITLVKHTLD